MLWKQRAIGWEMTKKKKSRKGEFEFAFWKRAQEASSSRAANDESVGGFSEGVTLTIAVRKEDDVWQLYLNEC